MKNRNFWLAAVALMGASIATAQAFARTTSPLIGRAANPNKYTCFSTSFGQVVQGGCAEQLTYDMPLPADNSGSKSVKITGSRPGAGAFSCTAIACNNTLSSCSSPSYSTWNTGDSNLQKTLSSVTLASGGALLAGCEMGQSSSINNVDYNH
jgi:hypothetical protein